MLSPGSPATSSLSEVRQRSLVLPRSLRRTLGAALVDHDLILAIARAKSSALRSALPILPAIGPTAASRLSDHGATRSPLLAGFHAAPSDAAAARPRSAPTWSRRASGRPWLDAALDQVGRSRVRHRYCADAVRLNHPRRDLARSIGICPAYPPTP